MLKHLFINKVGQLILIPLSRQGCILIILYGNSFKALIRNQIFQQVLIELQMLGVSFDDLIVSKFNFDQLLVSSIDTFKATEPRMQKYYLH